MCRTSPRTAKLSSVISERHQAMLEFERTWWNHDEPKDALIRARFQCSADDYYAELNDLVAQPGAMDHDPLVVVGCSGIAFGGAVNGSRPARMGREAQTHEHRRT